MLRVNYTIRRIALMVFLLWGLSSCSWIYEYDTCTDGLIVRSDWRYAREADPEDMAYIFFSSLTTDMWRFDFSGRSGGEVEIPDGRYRVICFNDDSATNLITSSTEGCDSVYVTTPKTGLYGSAGDSIKSVDGEWAIEPPKQMWGQRARELVLSDLGVEWDMDSDSGLEHSEEREIVLYPRAMMASYDYEISDVTNLEGVKRMRAALTGMASRLYIGDMRRSGPEAALALAAKKQSDAAVGDSFYTVGVPQSPVKSNILYLYVWLTDGRMCSYSFDVTEQVRTAPDPMHVHIKVAGVDLPESEPAEPGAFDVSVSGWDETIIDIVC